MPLLLFLGLVLVKPAPAVEFIVLSTTENRLYQLTTPLGPPIPIGTVASGTDLYELVEASPTTLYTFDRAANTLIEVSRLDATLLKVVQLDADVFRTRRGFDLSPDGILYGIVQPRVSGIGMQLRTIDPNTGLTTLIGFVTGAPVVEGIAFAPDGSLYAVGSLDNNASSETLFRLSPATGELTLIGTMNVSDIDALTFAPDGFLYGIDSQNNAPGHLIQINPSTAEVSDLGSTGVAGANGIVAITQTTLSIKLTGAAAIVSWPTNAAGFHLESSLELGSSAAWSPIPIEPATSGRRNFVTNPITDGSYFFRLSH